MPQEDVFLDLGVLFRQLLKSCLWLLPLCVIVGAGVFTLAYRSPPVFTSESRVLIDTSSFSYMGQDRGSESERALLDGQGVASQVQLLRSRDLARRVVQDLSLDTSEEFLEASRPGLFEKALASLGIAQRSNAVSDEQKALKKLIEDLEVYRVDDSRVISVNFTSQSPSLSARVANKVVGEYRSLQNIAKETASNTAAEALSPQVARLQREVELAERKIEEFRASANLLLGSPTQTLSQQQLSELNSRLSSAQVQQLDTEARAQMIAGLLKNGGSLETASEVLSSPLIQRLRERQIELKTRIAELSTTLLASHPQIKALRSQLNGYEQQIRSEARKIMLGLENDATMAQQRVEDLGARLERLKQDAAQAGTDTVRLQELERDAAAKTRQLETLMTNLREAEILRSAGILNAESRVISRASVPIEPSGPHPLALGALSAFACFFLGLVGVTTRSLTSGLALQKESYTVPHPQVVDALSVAGLQNAADMLVADRLRSQAQEEGTAYEHQSAPAPQQSPEADGLQTPTDTAPETSLSEPGLAKDPPHFAEEPATGYIHDPVSVGAGYDEVLTEQVQRVVVLSVDSENLSQQVALSCARKLAEKGTVPLFLEVRASGTGVRADTSPVHPLDSYPGFSELLEGSAAFSNVIQRDYASRAHIIETGNLPIYEHAIEEGRYGLIMDALDETYDIIIADLGLIEPSLICAQMVSEADRVIVATDGSPTGPELDRALDILEKHSGAPVEVECIPGGDVAAYYGIERAA
ncbi:exopolysaccharide transport family protein [Flexibacterium corallicola]|uniref:exopolysaccharide transport family protein n=1 Tax=Flexibacterium corallicola TaxID=3037259 RepID=UPI00286F2EA0|nr:exopolysaccharide transport family protein [Pseudovibrio sp. M1P-2-3]